MKKLSHNLLAIFTFAGIFLSITAHAQTLSLNFNALPSTQGWTYVTAHSSTPDSSPTVSETSIFSVSNNILQQNTLGQGNLQAAYTLHNYANFTQPYTASVRARILAQDNGSDPYGFEFGFHSDLWGTGFAIGMGIIKDFDGTTISNSINTAVFHDYQFNGNPDGSYTFYIDGILIATGNGVLYSSLPYTVDNSVKQIIYFGDGTPTGSNALAEIANYTFSQTIPEPETFHMILMGACILRLLHVVNGYKKRHN